MQSNRWLTDSRLTVVVGHSGSGKTEFAVNLALALADQGKATALADLDVVNPYFRSRQRRELLTGRGVELVAPSRSYADADLPALPAQLNTLLQPDGPWSVLDVGGGATGARVMGRYGPQLAGQKSRIVLVLNARRWWTNTPQGAIECLKGIEATMGVTVTHLVNNTHLCEETTPEDIRLGARLAQAVSRETGIPILCHVLRQSLIPQLEDLEAPLFPVRVYMNKPWEISGAE
jgi:energy-coupling factor transporter ATP-binding protein EcfA2